MKFPQDYPYSPPSIRFLTKVWHPNVYEVSTTSLTLHFSYRNTDKRKHHLFKLDSRTAISASAFSIHRWTILSQGNYLANVGIRHRTCALYFWASFLCWMSQTLLVQRTWTHRLCIGGGGIRRDAIRSTRILSGENLWCWSVQRVMGH